MHLSVRRRFLLFFSAGGKANGLSLRSHVLTLLLWHFQYKALGITLFFLSFPCDKNQGKAAQIRDFRGWGGKTGGGFIPIIPIFGCFFGVREGERLEPSSTTLFISILVCIMYFCISQIINNEAELKGSKVTHVCT